MSMLWDLRYSMVTKVNGREWSWRPLQGRVAVGTEWRSPWLISAVCVALRPHQQCHPMEDVAPQCVGTLPSSPVAPVFLPQGWRK